MKKDAFYFPHFANSRHDRKIMRVRIELGLEGYAIYFMLLEVLREQNDFKYPLDDIYVLAHEFNISEQKVRVVICNYGLFEVDENENFFSIKQIYYLQPYIEKTQRARLAAQKRWDRVEADANAMQMHSKCNADAMQIKESKVKEILYRDNISLLENENEKLVFEYGQDFINACYDLLSSYKIEKSYKTKSDYLTIKRWVIDAVTEKGKFKPKTIKLNTDNKLNAELEEYKKRQSELGQSL